MNHRVNAQLHKLPECPECRAVERAACVDDFGRVRAPHRVRDRLARGEVFVVDRAVAKAKGKVRVMIELVASMAVRSRSVR